jgi:hypothetical protein
MKKTFKAILVKGEEEIVFETFLEKFFKDRIEVLLMRGYVIKEEPKEDESKEEEPKEE